MKTSMIEAMNTMTTVCNEFNRDHETIQFALILNPWTDYNRSINMPSLFDDFFYSSLTRRAGGSSFETTTLFNFL